jgi:hypothetical protein
MYSTRSFLLPSQDFCYFEKQHTYLYDTRVFSSHGFGLFYSNNSNKLHTILIMNEMFFEINTSF